MAVPDFNFGAMENWGLIIYREAILYQPGVTSASYEYWMGTVISHEIAHMVGLHNTQYKIHNTQSLLSTNDIEICLATAQKIPVK